MTDMTNQEFDNMVNNQFGSDFDSNGGDGNNFDKAFGKSGNLGLEPNNITGWQLLGKTLIGLAVGGIITALLFVVLSFIGSVFTDALQNQGPQFKTNPLLPIILLFIGFLGSFIGNLIVSGLYNLFYSKRYYDSSKTFALLLLTNAIMFFVLAPIYLIFTKQIGTLFFVLGFHILFSVFISACQIEFVSNVNYSASSLIGNMLGLSVAFLVYSIVYKIAGVSSIQQQTYLLMLLPSVLGFTLVPFFAGIWEKIYYKFYEMGNNGFFIMSVNEVEKKSGKSNKKSEDDEINVDFG